MYDIIPAYVPDQSRYICKSNTVNLAVCYRLKKGVINQQTRKIPKRGSTSASNLVGAETCHSDGKLQVISPI